MKYGHIKAASYKSSAAIHAEEPVSKSSVKVAQVHFRLVEEIARDQVLPEVAWAYARLALNSS
jgi:hypothetical protein